MTKIPKLAKLGGYSTSPGGLHAKAMREAARIEREAEHRRRVTTAALVASIERNGRPGRRGLRLTTTNGDLIFDVPAEFTDELSIGDSVTLVIEARDQGTT